MDPEFVAGALGGLFTGVYIGMLIGGIFIGFLLNDLAMTWRDLYRKERDRRK